MSAIHARDCAPCDAARQVVDALADRWDAPDNWSEFEATIGPGTLRDEALRIAANVLHRFPLGGPPMSRRARHRGDAATPEAR